MLTQENFSSVIDEVMRGAIDTHVHFGPDMPPTGEIMAQTVPARVLGLESGM